MRLKSHNILSWWHYIAFASKLKIILKGMSQLEKTYFLESYIDSISYHTQKATPDGLQK